RRRAASESSSDSEEPGLAPAPPVPVLPASEPEREAKLEETDGDPYERPGATAAAGPGPRSAGAKPARPGAVLLSFGDEEKREGEEESFKIKKPSCNIVTFRIQKKENQLPAETGIKESKEICQLEPATGNTKGSHEEEEDDENDSSLSEDYNRLGSENESSPLRRRKDLSPGNIPSTACFEAARRKHHLARAQDYLPLDVSNSPRVSLRRESSEESEDEFDRKNLNFLPGKRTLRQRLAEHMGEFVLFFIE
ncbi:GCFC2 factor, partial [Rhinopomastus cyanomelas]|nr:GCFC2 factor [Rhinopomastus cyanomelas]